MKHARGRLVVACLAVAAAAIAVAGGSAGNRAGTPTLEAVPGPGAVSYGREHRVHGVVLERRQLDLHAHHVHDGAAGDPGDRRDRHVREGVVRRGRLGWRADVRLRATQVRRARTAHGRVERAGRRLEAGCTGANCLVANSTWLINENKSTNGNETFTQAETADLIGSSATRAGQQPASGRRLRDHGLRDRRGSSLNTNQAVSKNNPVATSFCLPGASRRPRPISGSRPRSRRQRATPARRRCASRPSVRTARPAPARTSAPPAASSRSRSGSRPTRCRRTTRSRRSSTTATRSRRRRAPRDNECVTSIKLDRKTGIWKIVTTAETNGPWGLVK